MNGQFASKLEETIPICNNNPADIGQSNIVVIVPAFNEERFIGSVVIKLLMHPVEVLVIDDGSEDNTSAIARAAGATVITQVRNGGKGTALNLGFVHARRRQPDVVVVIDADGQHLPEELPRLVAPILTQQADIVIGSRYLEKTCTAPVFRRIGHKLINMATSVPSGINVTDSQSGFRAFSRQALDLIQFNATDFSVESEMQFLAREYQLKIVEVPITIRYTDQAKRPAVKQGVIVLNGILRLVGQYRPLLFFSLVGLTFLTAGFIWGMIVVRNYIRTQELAAGYAMITLLLSLMGTVILSTGITLHSVRALLSDMFEAFSKKIKND
jgi:glycosyltransferase involved in cell wall biosynthesis